jgi:hypothetical protein
MARGRWHKPIRCHSRTWRCRRARVPNLGHVHDRSDSMCPHRRPSGQDGMPCAHALRPSHECGGVPLGSSPPTHPTRPPARPRAAPGVKGEAGKACQEIYQPAAAAEARLSARLAAPPKARAQPRPLGGPTGRP